MVFSKNGIIKKKKKKMVDNSNIFRKGACSFLHFVKNLHKQADFADVIFQRSVILIWLKFINLSIDFLTFIR